MTDQDKIELLAASYAAHGIKTREDFANYCRPPRWLCCVFAALGIFAALVFSLVLHVLGMIPASWIAYCVACSVPVAFGAVFGLRSIFDVI